MKQCEYTTQLQIHTSCYVSSLYSCFAYNFFQVRFSTATVLLIEMLIIIYMEMNTAGWSVHDDLYVSGGKVDVN